MNDKIENSIVYIVGPSFGTRGGISSVLLIYYNHFRDSHHMRFIPSYSGNSRMLDLCYFAVALLRIFFICLSGKRAVFHIHSSTYGSFLRKSMIARLCMAFHRKVIFHIHGADFDAFLDEAKGWRRNIIIRLLNKVDSLVVLSGNWKEYFSRFVPPEKICVIVNPSATVKSRVMKRNHSKVKVLFIGRIGERKGAYDLIEAVQKIRHLNFEVKMAGDGEGDQVRSLVKARNLPDKVSVEDWVPHDAIGALYDASDILVLPSYAEGLPMSVLEAIGKGIPVIATNVGGIPEAVIDGRNGFIIVPGDIEGLAEKMKMLICNAPLREEMGENSYKLATEKFSVEKNGEMLRELYSTLQQEQG